MSEKNGKEQGAVAMVAEVVAEAKEKKQAQLDKALVILFEQGANVPEVVRILLREGASADVTSRGNGETYPILVLAAGNRDRDNDDIVGMLLNANANIDDVSHERWTALMYAIYNKKPKSARLLIDKGAYVNAKGNDGHTALTLAILNNRQYDLVPLLLEHGADINISFWHNGVMGLLVEHVFIDRNETAVIFLFKNGAKIPPPTDIGTTFLMRAAANGLEKIVEYLCAHTNEDIAAKNNRGITATECAKFYGHTKIAEDLSCLEKNLATIPKALENLSDRQ